MRALRREPVLIVSLGYVLLCLIGLWWSVNFYNAFGMPILQYMQPADFLVAGLREPELLGVLLVAIVLMTLLNWPLVLRDRHRHRAEEFRRRWWGRLVYPRSRFVQTFFGDRLARVDTQLMVNCVLVTAALVYHDARVKADQVLSGDGYEVDIQMGDAASSPPERVLMLGTTAGFVIVHKPQSGRTDAIPIESVGSIRSMKTPPADSPPPGSRKTSP